MAHDACTEVRLSTVNGVIYLLGNPQSHEVLKVLLPRLGNLIMDSASAVRAAVADLLLLSNDIRNFHFHKVVSIDILVSTLANDQPLVARKITKLLMPSYFPSKVMEEEACKRMITLIKRSPTAGARFCEFAALEGASLRPLMKLFKVLNDLIMSSVKLDEEIVEGLLVAASHLCTNLAKDASFELALREELSAEKLKTFFTVASTSRAQSSICNIISTMSLDAVGDLFEDCMGLINRFCGLSDIIERQAEIRSAHKMILSCGWFDDMFGVLVGCLQKAACGCHAKFGIELGKQNVGSAKRRTKSSIKVSSKSKHCDGQRSSNTDINRFSEDYASAVGVSWQIKDLLLHENSRKAMLGSRHLESAYSALKVISEASVLYCLQYDYLNTWSVSAYTTLTLHMSLHNIKTDALISDMTLDHLLHCANNVFRANHNNTSDNDSLPSESLNSTNTKIAPGYSKDTRECQTGTSLTKQLRISNMVKMLTAVLKFVADATAMNLVTRSQDRCLNFTTENVKFIITNLREHSIAQSHITEEDLKDIFICLKSSLTYSSKLLNIMLKACEDSSCQAGAYSLVNELFNLIVSVEEFLGYGYAARLVTVIQSWVPDMILALGSNCLGKQTPDKGICSDSSENAAFHLPSWFYILARVELCEQRDTNSDDDTEGDQHAKDFSAFKRLVERMSMLLKSNNKILDAVGAIFLTGSLSALQSKRFDLVLGLLHFVSVKLVSPEHTEWKELKLMLASIEEIYPKVEREAEELGNNESDRQKLYSAKALLEPVWASFIYDDRRHSMEEE
ncbi:UNVERIFIED_CONTAM: hypothetical protein Sangu_1237200 [Sesamum angustifolium]|uniref:ARM repeat superfamily protein n=1 Tax=Sesamum angustifolium TaxID=2727405 RepID=A0AAW2NJI4_9LAMI